MEHTQKGFSTPVIVLSLVVVVGLIGVGVAYYKDGQPSTLNQDQTSSGGVPGALSGDTAKEIDAAQQSEVRAFIDTDLQMEYQGFGKETESARAITFEIQPLDLNSDGEAEYLVSDISVDGARMAGASGNATWYLYGSSAGGWRRIGTIDGNQYQLLPTRTNGYQDIETNWHLSAFEATKTTYSWDSSAAQYKKAKSVNVGERPE